MGARAGDAHQSSVMKHTAIVTISARTKLSITRIPSRVSHNISRVSKEVSNTPASNGIWNKRLRPMAAPSTSARSQAAMAISQSTHSAQETARG